MTILGFNYRMDELRAALGLVQLKKLPEWNDSRRRLSATYRELIAELCPSVMVTGSVFAPAVVLALTVALKVQVLLPWSLKSCEPEPPIELRSARTAMPVLAGFVPGVTLTVRVVLLPACTLFGLAEPVPDGDVDGATGVALTSEELPLSPAEFTALTT